MQSFKHILLLISLFSYLLPANAIWLSVDPLSDKYPHISPYAYCAWNPMKYVDPNGKEWLDIVATTMAKRRIKDYFKNN